MATNKLADSRRRRGRPSLWLCTLLLHASSVSLNHATFIPHSRLAETAGRSSHRIRTTYLGSIVDEEQLKSEIELSSHSEEDKVDLGKDLIGGSINVTNIEISPFPYRNGVTKPEEQVQPTIRSMWRRRNARSAEEGIRREKASKLSTLLEKASSIETQGRRYAARTITGLINALAEEVADLDVEVDARRNTPMWGKHVDAVRIKFSRLGFKPLRIGGLDQTIRAYDSEFPNSEDYSFTKPLSDLSCADEAFSQIDADNSGALDRDEIALALNLAAGSSEDGDDKRNMALMKDLAADLLQLYDLNGDGVVDRTEYQSMVEDMAALRKAQKDRKREFQENELEPENQKSKGWFGAAKDAVSGWFGNSTKIEVASEIQVEEEDSEPVTINGETVNGERAQEIINVSDSPEVIDSVGKTLGSVTFSDLKLDLRRLIFGAVPLLKHITPGGPLILEPFTTTINGSFNREDIMNSFLLDAGLRRLVARALRLRVRPFRDFIDGAVFYGRRWKESSGKASSAPLVEIPELTDVEFDKQDRLVITGRAKVQTRKDAPQIEQAFKVRTKLGTRKDGRTIRLVEPELAFVLECPKSFEKNIKRIYNDLNMEPPVRPKPLYSFFPIYSPFKVNDEQGGFYLGEDNCIKSIFIKDGALRFELSAVLRPGRFLGNHYIAFTVPNRTFIITLDRVKEGMKAARKTKKAKKAMAKALKQKERRVGKAPDLQEDTTQIVQRRDKRHGRAVPSKQPKSFFSRFVDGYLQAERDDEDRERLTNAIRDFFGRQGSNETR